MNTFILVGTSIVNLALVSYSIAIISEQRKRRISNFVLAFLTIGVTLDLTATVCMISGSTHSFVSSHGLIGYSSFIAMLTDCILLWKFRRKNGPDATVSKGLHLYSRIAYIWWILAYITGAIIVMARHAHS